MIGGAGFGFEVEAVDEQLGEGHLVAAFRLGVDRFALFGEAPEVGGGDLQSVEHGRGGFALERAVGKGAQHLVNGELEGVGVLDKGHHVRLGRAADVEVEVAVREVAQGGSLAGGAVGLGVPAAGSVLELGNRHGDPYRGVEQTKGVAAGIPGSWRADDLANW